MTTRFGTLDDVIDPARRIYDNVRIVTSRAITFFSLLEMNTDVTADFENNEGILHSVVMSEDREEGGIATNSLCGALERPRVVWHIP